MVKNFSMQGKNNGFICLNCNQTIPPLRNGSIRNHCPLCLHSKHVDDNPGDRNAQCGGDMEPIRTYYHSKKSVMIIHRCAVCGFERSNKAALEDVAMADDYNLILQLMSANP